MNKHMAANLASHGRHGDEHLLHVSADELRGIASLVPGGKLTINPVTGLPEAFSLKKILKTAIPMAAGIFAPMLLPALAPAIAGGIGSGLATAAVTGDLKRGLVGGVIGAGLGSAFGAAGDKVAKMGADKVGLNLANAGNPLESTINALNPSAAYSGMPGGTALSPAFGQKLAAPTLGQKLAAPFQKDSGILGELMKPQNALPIAIGAGQLGEMDARDSLNQLGDARQKEHEEKLKQSYGDLQRGYAAAQPGAVTGINPSRSYMSRNTPLPGYTPQPIYAAEGGITRLRPEFPGGSFSSGSNPGYQGIDPVTVQQNLRGAHRYTPPPGFVPGFSPEARYFSPTPNAPQPPVSGPVDWSQLYANSPINRFTPNKPYFQSFIKPRSNSRDELMNFMSRDWADRNKDRGGYAEGGQVATGGIANLPAQEMQQPQPQELQQVAAALSGQAGDQGDAIINAFIQKYGVDLFRQVREMVLQANVPGAQTEGLIEGQGGGMADEVPGMIGSEQPVAVSPGEYIVPADVVSGLGDGSSDSGAAELDQMAQRTRLARGGSVTQPQPFNARQVMPA